MQPGTQPTFGRAHGQHGSSSLRSRGPAGYMPVMSRRRRLMAVAQQLPPQRYVQVSEVAGAQTWLQSIVPEALWPYMLSLLELKSQSVHGFLSGL